MQSPVSSIEQPEPRLRERSRATRRTNSATHLRWLIGALGIACTLAITAVLILDLASARERALADAGRATETLAAALEEHAVQTFTRLDLGLRALDDDPTTPGLTFPSDLARAQAQLSQILRVSPTLRRLDLTDSSGRVVASGDTLRPPERNYAHVEAFAVQRDPQQGFYVGVLRMSPKVGDWTIAVSRRMETSDQRFAGAAIGSVNTEYFQRLYQSIDVRAQGSVSLYLRDGTLLARYPTFESLIGTSIEGDAIFRDYVSKGIAGTVRTIDSIDGLGRVASIRILRDLPLVLTVSMAERAVLAEWEIALRDSSVMVLVAILAIWGLVAVLWRMLSNRENWEDELAAAHAAEEQARRRAEHSNSAKSEFVATISHELRTPLNAILGFAELIGRETSRQGPGSRSADYARTIGEAGTRLLALVNDLLDLAKIEAGKFEIEEAPVDPIALARECLAMIAPQLEAGRLSCEVVPPARAFLLRADPGALHRVLLNILSNAAKFTPEGGCITVTVSTEPAGGARISVRDTGIGMSAADVERAFEPFGRVRNSNAPARQGTGLGLPIARRLMESHGGQLVMDSFPGSGTTVTIRLPASRVEPAAAIRPAQRQSG